MPRSAPCFLRNTPQKKRDLAGKGEVGIELVNTGVIEKITCKHKNQKQICKG